MRKFEAAYRTELESAGGDLMLSQLLEELFNIEAKAKKLKAEGKHPRAELAHEVEQLAGRVSLGYYERALAADEYIDTRREEYEKIRDRQPQNELARIQRAKLKIDSLSDKQAENLAQSFAAGVASLTAEEAQTLASRGTEMERETVRNAIRDQLIDKPWIAKDDEATQLYRESETLKSLPPGNVLIDGMAIHVEHLVDFDDAMDSPA